MVMDRSAAFWFWTFGSCALLMALPFRWLVAGGWWREKSLSSPATSHQPPTTSHQPPATNHLDFQLHLRASITFTVTNNQKMVADTWNTNRRGDKVPERELIQKSIYDICVKIRLPALSGG